jgi:hypothetical protein
LAKNYESANPYPQKYYADQNGSTDTGSKGSGSDVKRHNQNYQTVSHGQVIVQANGINLKSIVQPGDPLKTVTLGYPINLSEETMNFHKKVEADQEIHTPHDQILKDLQERKSWKQYPSIVPDEKLANCYTQLFQYSQKTLPDWGMGLTKDDLWKLTFTLSNLKVSDFRSKFEQTLIENETLKKILQQREYYLNDSVKEIKELRKIKDI